MPSYHLTVARNGGAPSTGAISCAWEDSVRLRLNNTAGVRSARFELYGFPEGWTVPAGWSNDALGRVYFSAQIEPQDFTLPAEVSNLWGKWLLRLLVNGVPVDDTSALEIVSPNGLHALPPGEGFQFGGAAQSWAKHLEINLRLLDAFITSGGGGGGPPSGAASGDLGGNYPGPSVLKLRTVPLAEAVEDAADTGGRILISSNPLGTPGNGSITLLPAPTQDQLLVFQDGVGLFWAEAPELEVTTYFLQYLGHPDSGLNLGAVSVPIGGSGTVALTMAQCQLHAIRFTGALTGNRTVTLPQANGGAGRVHTLVNATTGTHLLRVEGYAGGVCYLLPGQSKVVTTDDQDVMRGDDLRSLVLEKIIDLTGIAAGSTADVCALPANTTIDLLEGLETTAIEPGTLQLSAGTNTTPVDAIHRDCFADSTIGTVGTLHGKDKTLLGALLSTDGYGWLTEARTLKLKVGGVGTATAGQVRVFLRARYLGVLRLRPRTAAPRRERAPSLVAIRSHGAALGAVHRRHLPVDRHRTERPGEHQRRPDSEADRAVGHWDHLRRAERLSQPHLLHRRIPRRAAMRRA